MSKEADAVAAALWALERLRTVEEIAGTLRGLGVKGRANCAWRCPIAVYLARALGNAGPTVIVGRYYVTVGATEVALGAMVQAFIQQMDTRTRLDFQAPEGWVYPQAQWPREKLGPPG